MTILTELNKIQYDGDDSTVDFSFPYLFFEDGDLRVILADAAGVETVQTIITHYTVAGAGDPAGGTVTMLTAPATGETLTIIREVAYTQESDYINPNKMDLEVLERDLDEAAMQSQQLKEQISRALISSESSTASDLVLPNPVANKLLGWNDAADALENKNIIDGSVGVAINPGDAEKITIINAQEDGLKAYHKTPDELLLAEYGIDSGVADAYEVSLGPLTPTYVAGFQVLFKPANANTGASTLNVDLGGVKTITRIDGTALKFGDLAAGMIAHCVYDGTNFQLLNPNADRYTPPMHIQGLVISNNGGDADHDLDIATGEARDITDADTMVLESAFTKSLGPSSMQWAVGTGNGGLDGQESTPGTPDADTWYHVWLIKRSDTGLVDVLFSESATAPTMPTNYDRKRRIGSVLTDGSANILGFQMFEAISGVRSVLWDDPPLDIDVTDLGTSSTDYTLSVPTGFNVRIIMNAVSFKSASQASVYIRNPDTDDEAPSQTAGPLSNLRSDATGVTISRHIIVLSNMASQISARSSLVNTTFRIATLGWEE